MTNDDLCPECAHPLSEHPDGLACCRCGKHPQYITYEFVDEPDGYSIACDCGIGTIMCDSTDKARRIWNNISHPSPWLNAPIPEEGEAQTLFVIADGTWNIAVPNKGYYKGFDSDEWTEIACGFNGGPAGKWTRTMRDGKLVYEEVKG